MRHCYLCGGWLKYLGQLCSKVWFHCEACGIDQGVEITELEREEEEDEDA
jgi:hypothetical protein